VRVRTPRRTHPTVHRPGHGRGLRDARGPADRHTRLPTAQLDAGHRTSRGRRPTRVFSRFEMRSCGTRIASSQRTLIPMPPIENDAAHRPWEDRKLGATFEVRAPAPRRPKTRRHLRSSGTGTKKTEDPAPPSKFGSRVSGLPAGRRRDPGS
jgi:hypothetical protein